MRDREDRTKALHFTTGLRQSKRPCEAAGTEPGSSADLMNCAGFCSLAMSRATSWLVGVRESMGRHLPARRYGSNFFPTSKAASHPMRSESRSVPGRWRVWIDTGL